MRTPWGTSDWQKEYAPGITLYTTPSHGGFHLTPAREAELEAALAPHGITAEQARMGYEPGWYEEDCSALAVLVVWPELFPDAEPDPDRLARLRYWIGYDADQRARVAAVIAADRAHRPDLPPHGAHDTEGPTVLHLGHTHTPDELADA